MQKPIERRKGSRVFLSRATLVPPQTLKGGNMIDHTFYRFLSACQGNWRNSVYISTDGPGYLLSANRDGRPIVMPVEQFQRLTGEIIDPPSAAASLPMRASEPSTHSICSGVCRRQKMIRCVFSVKAAQKWTEGNAASVFRNECRDRLCIAQALLIKAHQGILVLGERF